MKLWNMILQNVLSGCVGALLVMSVARAQKTDPTATRPEIRTQKLFIVDDAGSEIGYLGVNADGPILRFKSGEHGLQLSVSKKSGPCARLESAHDRVVNVYANNSSAGVTTRSGSTSVSLDACDRAADMMLSMGDYSINSEIRLAVTAGNSDVRLVGPKALISLGHAPHQPVAGLFCDMHNPSGAAFTLSDNKMRVYWSKFPPDVSKK